MAILTLTRKPAKKYSLLHAGDYELWVNNQYYAPIPNSGEPISFEFKTGIYQVQVKKSALMRSPVVAVTLNENLPTRLTTGTDMKRIKHYLVAMSAYFLTQLLLRLRWCESLFRNTLLNPGDSILFVIAVILLSILVLRFGNPIFLKKVK